MAMNLGRGDTAVAQINVTPMADIMIVLLVIFMVVTPILDQDVRVPAAAHAEEKSDDAGALVVSIRSDRTLFLDGTRLDNLGELVLSVTERLALAADNHVVYLRADEGLPYSEVLKVLEACREAGADESPSSRGRRSEADDAAPSHHAGPGHQHHAPH